MSEDKIPVAKGLIQNQDGEFLMLKKADDYGFTAGKWEQPGGKIEEDEDRFEAFRREIKEETGLEIGKTEDVVRIEIEASDHINCYVIYTEDFEGEVNLSEEHSEYRWVSESEIDELEFHRDSSYVIPPLKYLEHYLSSDPDNS